MRYPSFGTLRTSAHGFLTRGALAAAGAAATTIPALINKNCLLKAQRYSLFTASMLATLSWVAPALPDSSVTTVPSPGVTAPSSTACTVFVSANGDDGGDSGNRLRTFATLERARDYVRTIKANATGPINVCLRGGTHVLKRTFTLGPEDSGTATAPITYRSSPGESAIISGGTQLDLSWAPYSGEIYVATTQRKFNSLFVNGRRAIRARTPTADASFPRLTPVAGSGGLQYSPSQFVYVPGSLPAGLKQSDIEIVSMARFFSPRQKVYSTDATTVTVNGSVTEYYGYDYYPNKGRYYVENSLAALDAPGEWYLDETAHKLYYWPRDPAEIKEGEFVAPHLYQLVSGGSYPDNTSFLKIGEEPPYNIPSCRHLGVYPSFPHSLSFADTSFTVALWISFPPGTTNPFWAFSKGDPWGNDATTGAGGNGYGLRTDSVSDTVPVQFFINDGTHRLSANISAQPRGKWIHLAFVVDHLNRKTLAYLNGALADTQDISALGSIDSKLPLDIGAYTNAGCSTSAISDYRIYSGALSEAQIASIVAGAPPSTGLALDLPFDGSFRDASTQANQTVPFYAPAFTIGVNGAKAADFSTSAPFDVSGAVDNIGFSGLEFKYTDWTLPFTGYPGGSQEAIFWASPSAVYLHSHNARVTGNRFQHIGSHALSGMLGSSSVSNNFFTDIGGGAIRIGQSAALATDLTVLAEFSSNDSITGNRVDTTGVVVRDSAALMILQGENNIISQNLITNAPDIGLSVGWFAPTDGETAFKHGGNNRVELNRVNHVMQLLNDGSGLYILGYQPGTIVERNVFHDIVVTPAQWADIDIWGIYLDGTSASMMVRDNLTYRIQDGGIMLNAETAGAGNGNTVKNNIFVDGVDYQLYFNGASNDTFFQNIVFYGGTSTSIFPAVPGKPIGSSNNNLFFSPSYPNFPAQLATWQKLGGFGFDSASIVADPLFIDYAHDNFTLSPSSPALLPFGSGGIGFVPIDFSGLP